MNTVYYYRRHGGVECARIDKDSEDTKIRLRFDGNFSGSVRLGKTLKKIDGNSCIFDTGSLCDGIYTPKIYLESSIIDAEPFEISGGIPKLIPKSDSYIRELAKETWKLKCELSKIKEQLSEYDKKINGTKIF